MPAMGRPNQRLGMDFTSLADNESTGAGDEVVTTSVTVEHTTLGLMSVWCPQPLSSD